VITTCFTGAGAGGVRSSTSRRPKTTCALIATSPDASKAFRQHTEGNDLVFKAVVLELLVKVALIAVQNKQPVPPHLTRLCMPVKVLQPLQTERVISPAVLRD
jgi:hypothetical protein